MGTLVKINDRMLEKRLYRNEPVLTLREIDELHQRVEKTAKRNFHQNREHFIEGVDYFSLPYEEWTDLMSDDSETENEEYGDGSIVRNSPVQISDEESLRVRNSYPQTSENGDSRGGYRGNLFMITLTGYMMLVKSFKDDLSWDIQRLLVMNYFNQRVPANCSTIDKDRLINLLESRAELAEMKLAGWVRKSRWTEEEKTKARQLAEEGLSLAAIGVKLNRTREAVKQIFIRMNEQDEKAEMTP